MAETLTTTSMEEDRQDDSTTTVAYRRNGKLFSCEPCRKGKLACDHSSPVCGRCLRRNKPDQCIYHPAPLTKPAGPGKQRVTPSTTRSHRASPYPLSRTQSGLASPPASNDASQGDFTKNRAVPGRQSPAHQMAPMPSDPAVSFISYNTPESSVSFRDSRTGFLGLTAYSAVFTENTASLGPEVDTEDDLLQPPIHTPEDRIASGANVLAMLRDLPTYRRFTERWFSTSEGIIVPRPACRIWLEDLWSEYGQVLTEGDPKKLRSLSELIWRNTRNPPKTHGNMTAKEWAKAASGKNQRWETIGIILSIIGMVAVDLSNWDSLLDDIRDRYVNKSTFAEKMRKASECCLCFCYDCESLNDIYVCSMYMDLILVECTKGDAHYAVWQRNGELCDAIVAMGVHQGNYVDAETPFFISEIRRKIFVCAYSRDKQVSSFLGRPPRLSYRYCKMEMPLDLTDEHLFLDNDLELNAVISKLDVNGWNTHGALYRTTWNRVWFQECRIREEILELALGSSEGDIGSQAHGIRMKLNAVRHSFPDFMKISATDLLEATDPSKALPGQIQTAPGQIDALFYTCVHAGLMHTEFLLTRAKVSRTKTDTKELIPISRDILKLVLLSQAKREFFRNFSADLIYLMATHGLPTAGVLAIELLKQEQSRQYTPDILPRSETIQDLSVFISCLAMVSPGEGNFTVCNQGRRALKRVVDQILSPSLPQATEPTFDDMQLFYPQNNDAEFLQWLENVEWDRGLMNPVPNTGLS